MVLDQGRNQIGRGQILLSGFEIHLIAERRILRHCDHRCFTVFALGSLDTLFALLARVALFTLGSLDTLFALRSRATTVALYTLRTDLSLGSLLSYGYLLSDRSTLSLLPAFSAGTHRSLRTGITLRSGGPPIALDAARSHRALYGHIRSTRFGRTAVTSAISCVIIIHRHHFLRKIVQAYSIVCSVEKSVNTHSPFF